MSLILALYNDILQKSSKWKQGYNVVDDLVEHIGAETKWPPYPDAIFKCIFLNENIWISIKISPKFVP